MAQKLEWEIFWMQYGACKRVPDANSVMFPHDGAGVAAAKKICLPCPVKKACLEYALTEGIDHGVWGGESERGRRRIRKLRGGG